MALTWRTKIDYLTKYVNNCGTGNLELAAAGSLPADYWDWESGRRFRFVKDHEDVPEEEEEGKDEGSQEGATDVEELPLGRRVWNPTFKGAQISHPFRLAPADSFRTPYTNYVRG